MHDTSPPTRVYGDKEIARILERATELSRNDPGVSGSAGMTLSELEEVAREAGIDISLVRRAAMEMDGDGDERAASAWEHALGERTAIVRETLVEGELLEEDLEELVGLIQGSVNDHGQASVMGRTLTWQGGPSDNTRKVRVIVSCRDGWTRIRVEEHLGQLAGGLYGGLLGGLGMGVGLGVGLPLGLAVLHSAAVAVAAPIGVLGLTYMGVRYLYQGIVRSRREILDRLFDRLVEEVERGIEAEAPEDP